jgi:hypothetical protein
MKKTGWLLYLALLFGGIAVAFLVTMPRDNLSDQLRTTGGVLELWGLVAVGWGITARRSEFGVPSVFREIGQEIRDGLAPALQRLQKLLGKKKSHRLIAGHASFGVSASVGEVEARVIPGPNSSVERRVELLERDVAELYKKVRTIKDGLAAEIADRKADVLAEADKRTKADEELAAQLKGLAVGNVRLEIVGVVWLLVGVVLATWANEIASALERT